MTRIEYLQEIKKLLPPNPVCVEIGVYRGDFSKMILDELQPTQLNLIDTFRKDDSKKYPDGQPVSYSGAYELLEVSTKFFTKIGGRQVNVFADYSYNVVNEFNDGEADFIYIDASHLYEDVKRDLIDYYLKLKSNGIIGGHDYGNSVFTGVKKAVDEFMEEKNLKMVLLSEEGDFALR